MLTFKHLAMNIAFKRHKFTANGFLIHSQSETAAFTIPYSSKTGEALIMNLYRKHHHQRKFKRAKTSKSNHIACTSREYLDTLLLFE